MDNGEQSNNGWRRTDFLASPFTKYDPVTFVLMDCVKEKYGVEQSNTSMSNWIMSCLESGDLQVCGAFTLCACLEILRRYFDTIFDSWYLKVLAS
jgi:hypothetical protein